MVIQRAVAQLVGEDKRHEEQWHQRQRNRRCQHDPVEVVDAQALLLQEAESNYVARPAGRRREPGNGTAKGDCEGERDHLTRVVADIGLVDYRQYDGEHDCGDRVVRNHRRHQRRDYDETTQQPEGRSGEGRQQLADNQRLGS